MMVNDAGNLLLSHWKFNALNIRQSWNSDINGNQMKVNKISHETMRTHLKIRHRSKLIQSQVANMQIQSIIKYVENMVLMKLQGALSDDFWLINLYWWPRTSTGVSHSLQWPVIDINNNVEMMKPANSQRCNRNISWRGHQVSTVHIWKTVTFILGLKTKYACLLTPPYFVLLCERQISLKWQENEKKHKVLRIGWLVEVRIIFIVK